MLNLSPNKQRPTVYTNFLLGSRTFFFLFSVGYLGQARVFGCWVLESHFAFHLYSKESLAWHGMAWSLWFCTLQTRGQPCNWKTRCLRLYPLLRDAPCMFLLEPGVEFRLCMIGHPTEYMPPDLLVESLCLFHPSARRCK
jgi:hypothetical protein